MVYNWYHWVHQPKPVNEGRRKTYDWYGIIASPNITGKGKCQMTKQKDCWERNHSKPQAHDEQQRRDWFHNNYYTSRNDWKYLNTSEEASSTVATSRMNSYSCTNGIQNHIPFRINHTKILNYLRVFNFLLNFDLM